jgi:2-amino-1-hydroxyethylphosphonate dioxygenase (glycine-forming)
MDIQTSISEVFGLYEQFGNADYIGEPVSQLEHMGQAAQLAEQEGFDEETILAAFFHDIGHLTPAEAGHMGGYGNQSHEKLGADYLRQHGFSEKICLLVESHVSAKRYLTYKYPEYLAQLSEASLATLGYQGGPMNEQEASDFEQHPLFKAFLRMRHWDEQAKLTEQPLPDLGRYKMMAERHLQKKNK